MLHRTRQRARNLRERRCAERLLCPPGSGEAIDFGRKSISRRVLVSIATFFAILISWTFTHHEDDHPKFIRRAKEDQGTTIDAAVVEHVNNNRTNNIVESIEKANVDGGVEPTTTTSPLLLELRLSLQHHDMLDKRLLHQYLVPSLLQFLCTETPDIVVRMDDDVNLCHKLHGVIQDEFRDSTLRANPRVQIDDQSAGSLSWTVWTFTYEILQIGDSYWRQMEANNLRLEASNSSVVETMRQVLQLALDVSLMEGDFEILLEKHIGYRLQTSPVNREQDQFDVQTTNLRPATTTTAGHVMPFLELRLFGLALLGFTTTSVVMLQFFAARRRKRLRRERRARFDASSSSSNEGDTDPLYQTRDSRHFSMFQTKYSSLVLNEDEEEFDRDEMSYPLPPTLLVRVPGGHGSVPVAETTPSFYGQILTGVDISPKGVKYSWELHRTEQPNASTHALASEYSRNRVFVAAGADGETPPPVSSEADETVQIMNLAVEGKVGSSIVDLDESVSSKDSSCEDEPSLRSCEQSATSESRFENASSDRDHLYLSTPSQGSLESELTSVCFPPDAPASGELRRSSSEPTFSSLRFCADSMEHAAPFSRQQRFSTIDVIRETLRADPTELSALRNGTLVVSEQPGNDASEDESSDAVPVHSVIAFQMASSDVDADDDRTETRTSVSSSPSLPSVDPYTHSVQAYMRGFQFHNGESSDASVTSSRSLPLLRAARMYGSTNKPNSVFDFPLSVCAISTSENLGSCMSSSAASELDLVHSSDGDVDTCEEDVSTVDGSPPSSIFLASANRSWIPKQLSYESEDTKSQWSFNSTLRSMASF